MLKLFVRILLKRWPLFVGVMILITAFMGYQGSKIQLSYDFAKVLPSDDSTYIAYKEFKDRFGEDGNLMVVGFKDDRLFDLSVFNGWEELASNIRGVSGISNVLSFGSVYRMQKSDTLKKFEFTPLVQHTPTSQSELDSIKQNFLAMPFYEGVLYSKENNATLMAIVFDQDALNSERRLEMVKEIKVFADDFAIKHNIDLHYSGMPYIRSAFMKKVSQEMTLFLVMAILATAIVLWILFRSFKTMFYSVIVVLFGVVWSVGLIYLFGYKITILSGLIPPLMMVIGIPNCVFLFNKYYAEFLLHGDKNKAIATAVENTGLSLLLANLTTAIGFGVLYFTNSLLLVEFGVVASISVMITYFITVILIPVILYLLPEPKQRYTRHLSSKNIAWMLKVIDHLVHKKRKLIYFITIAVTLISCYGMTKINIVGYVVDDMPKKHVIYSDLRFFEHNFHGILPFEIVIDTKSPKGLYANNATVVYKAAQLQKVINKYNEFSKPISLIEGLKFSYQAYRGGSPKYYVVPNAMELRNLSGYLSSNSNLTGQLKGFVDSTQQYTRISYKVADVGSQKMEELVSKIRPQIDSIFNPAQYSVSLTGHSLMFLKNNNYLLDNLIESLIIEIVLIALLGLALFRSVRIILLSKLPCLIPLVITAGIMGFLNIPFKSSTILIFSIAFGISSDGSIYFLTKYRQELVGMRRSSVDAISATLRETGLSMAYSTIILFFGFAIFAASDFGGTMALGVLVSLTLLMSFFTNVILLPSLLISINYKPKKKLNKPQ